MTFKPSPECVNKLRICDAIALQFTRPLIYDYPIPDYKIIKRCLSVALYKICGLKKGKNVDDLTPICSELFTHPEKLSKRIIDLIQKVTSEYYDSDAFLKSHFWSEYLFGHEWFYMKGDFFRFRDIEKAHKEVSAHFTKKEMEEINNLGKIMRKELDKT